MCQNQVFSIYKTPKCFVKFTSMRLWQVLQMSLGSCLPRWMDLARRQTTWAAFPAKQQKPSIAKQILQRKISVDVPRCRETYEVCVATRK